MVTKLALSREYLYIPIAELNVAAANISLSRVAFIASPGTAPLDADWEDAAVVDSGDPGFVASIGDSIIILIGPARGDSVTTIDVAVGDYQVWVEIKITGSDERPVRIAGTLEVETA